MALVPPSRPRRVTGITPAQEQSMRSYVQGAVYSWIRDRSGEQFAARDLFGGLNWEWQGTPLYGLFQKHVRLGKSTYEAMTGAAQDLGWLLKSVLTDDKRHFRTGRSGQTAGYTWIGGEP